MPADIENMAYSLTLDGRGVPWHGLGTPMGDGFSIAEALVQVPEVAADVTPWRLEAVAPDGRRIAVDESHPVGAMVANVREPVLGLDGVKAETILGIVSDQYRIAHTREQFEPLEDIIGQEGLVVETVLSLRGGRTNAVLLRRPEPVILAGDATLPYLLIANSYDASQSLTFAATAIRVVCTNTLEWALSDSATRKYTMRHAGRDLSDRIDEARKALGLADKYIEFLAQKAERLATHKVSTTDLNRILAYTFPVAPKSEDETGEQFERRQRKALGHRQTVRTLLRDGDNLHEHRDSAWGVVNAVIEWHDHIRNVAAKKGDSPTTAANRSERRFRRIMLESSPEVVRVEQAVSRLVAA